MPSSDLVGSVVKALDILLLIAESSSGMRLNEIASSLQMKNTTVHNLLRSLRARGFVTMNSSNQYIPGIAISNIARNMLSKRLFAAVSSDLILWQKRYPEATITFSELTPGAIYCRLRVSPDCPGLIQRPLERVFAPYASATSVLLQSCGNNASLFERNFPFDEHGANYWSDIDEFLRQKQQIRHTGYYVIDKPGRFLAAFFIPENYAIGFSTDSQQSGIVESVQADVYQLCQTLNTETALTTNDELDK